MKNGSPFQRLYTYSFVYIKILAVFLINLRCYISDIKILITVLLHS